MRKLITTLTMFAMMAIMIPMFTNTANAQTRRYYSNGRTYSTTYKKPSFYSKHRNLINIAIGTGAGALLGGIIGGKKGALLGTAIGAGGSALYTYKLNPKTKKYYRVYNNRRY
jgi:hypothetical protein